MIRRTFALLLWLPLLTVLLVGMTACTADDGRPWGRIDPTFVVQQDFSERMQDGALRTSEGFLIEIEHLALIIEALELQVPDDSSAVRFDPANPPEGYGHCHNGHCHADDGRLVDYDEIIEELAGDSGAGGSGIQFIPQEHGVVLSDTPQTPALEDCHDCDLARGDVRGARLYVDELELMLHVRDERRGVNARLPAEGVRIEADLHVHASVFSLLEIPFGPKHKPFVSLEWKTHVLGSLFDDVAWDSFHEEGETELDLSEDEDFEAQLREAIEHHIHLEFTVERRSR